MEINVAEYQISYLDFSEICRICLSVKKDMNILFQNIDIIKKLNEFTVAEVNLNDGLPSHICKDCSLTVDQCYNFKTECEKSYRVLKEIQNKYTSQQRLEIRKTIEKNVTDDSINFIEGNNTIEDDDMKQECYSYSDNNDFNALWKENETNLKNAIYNVQAVITSTKSYSDDNANDSSITTSLSKVSRGRKKAKKPIQNRVRKSKRNLESNKEQPIQDIKPVKTREKKVSPIIDSDKSSLLCKLCNKTFASIRSHKKHLERHNGSMETYTCEICSKIYFKKSHLLRHMKKLHNVVPEPCFCTFCGKWLKDERNLKDHIRYAHQGPKKREICPDCGSSVVNIRFHRVRVHATVRPYKCSECNEAFSKECFLNSHVKARHTRTEMHRVERLCELCGKILANSVLFRNHMRGHTGERPFKCSMCYKSYRLKKSLTSHMYNHTGVRPFECTTCHKRYVTKKNLQLHQLIHTGEKPHQCNICGQTFRQKSTLMTHTKLIHTGEKRTKRNTSSNNFDH